MNDPIGVSSQPILPGSENLEAEALILAIYEDETVEIEPTSSLIDDAIEEISMAIAQQRSKDDPELKKANRGLSDTYEKLKRIQALMESAPDMPNKDQLADLPQKIRNFLDKAENQNAKSLRDYLSRDGFKDETHQYIALKFAQESFKDHPADTEFYKIVSESLTDLMAGEGAARIKAGLNVSTIASDPLFKDLGSVQKLREDYRDVVIPTAGFAKTFENILTLYGEKNFEKGVQYLLRASANDMAAHFTSVPKTQLEETREALYQMSSMKTIMAQSSRLLGRVQSYIQKVIERGEG